MSERYYPPNFEDQIKNYQEISKQKIIEEYNRIYDQRKETIKDEICTRYDDDYRNYEAHQYLLNASLIPFVENQIPNHSLLLIDFLYFSKEGLNLEHTFDFLVAEVQNKTIMTLIFGEIKGGKTTDISNLDELKKYMTDKKIRQQLKSAILQTTSDITIDFDRIRFEFVLVIQAVNKLMTLQSLKDRKLPYILWSLNRDIRNIEQYNIEIKEDVLPADVSTELSLQGFNLNHKYHALVNIYANLKQHHHFLEFTPLMDFTFVLDCIREEYIQNYGPEIEDTHLLEIIDEVGGGHYYESDEHKNWLVQKIREKGTEFGIIRMDGKKFIFRIKMNFREHILERRFKEKIETQSGIDILNGAIANTKPLKIPSLDKFFKKKKQ